MTRLLSILLFLCGCHPQGEGQPVVWFAQEYRGFHLFKIDVNQTLDDGTTLTASSTPYFADIGEQPLPTNIITGNNRIVAEGWYTNDAGTLIGPIILSTNVTGAGIEMVAATGPAQFKSTTDFKTWTAISEPSPYIVPMNTPQEFFETAQGTTAKLFSTTPLLVQYLTYQPDVEMALPQPLPIP